MSFEIKGQLVKKFDIESKTASFQTREFVILISKDNYPQYVKFQLAQERVNLIDPYNETEEIKVHFDLRGREWQGKYFTNLNAWKIEKGGEDVVGHPNDIPFEVNDGSFDDSPF